MRKGIWRFADKFDIQIESKYRLSLGEGNTPLVKVDNLFFKREDLNPNGSVKDRGISVQISAWLQKGKHRYDGLVISSSGNAAISAAAYSELAGVDLTVFVSNKIPDKKLEALNKYQVRIVKDSQPVSSAHRYAKNNKLYNLRPSKDEMGSVGYQTIGYELQEQLANAGSIWFPVSSGTTLLGVGESYDKLPQLHVVQTTKVHSIARYFDDIFVGSPSSLASGLVAKVAPRKQEVVSLVNQSGGGGWVVNDEQILETSNWLKERSVFTSYEGAAALAGYFKAKKAGFDIAQSTVILLTGSL